MVVEKRVYKALNPVLKTGAEYEFHRTDTGYYVYESQHRGRGVVNTYQAEFYKNLPEFLQLVWDKGTPF